MFESNVILDGIQTLTRPTLHLLSFESNVILDGIQTKAINR